MKLAGVFVLCLLGCAGCATLPDGDATYYLTKTQVRLKVTRTVACDAKNNLVSFSAVTLAPLHAADPERPVKIPFAKLHSIFADTDMKIDFRDDGRLQALNGSFTGHGEEILKAFTSIISTAAVTKRAPAVRIASAGSCAYIAGGTNNKTLTLNYEDDFTLKEEQVDQWQEIRGDALTQAAASNMPDLTPVCVVLVKVRKPEPPFSRSTAADALEPATLITMQQPALVNLSVRTKMSKAACEDEVWNGWVPMAQWGTKYELPLLKAPMFGTQKVIIAVGESGTVTSLQYVGNTGAAQALNVVSDALAKVNDHARQQAEAINNEVSLIIAQQRLAKCRADPANCQ